MSIEAAQTAYDRARDQYRVALDALQQAAFELIRAKVEAEHPGAKGVTVTPGKHDDGRPALWPESILLADGTELCEGDDAEVDEFLTSEIEPLTECMAAPGEFDGSTLEW